MKLQKVKTWHGTKYAVLEPFTSTTKDKNGNTVTTTEDLVVEYKVGDRVEVAIFPVTDEGLERAKEVLNTLKK